ncbi:hypothetical protein CIHG_07237 [Coccidioides immitis H538.4]|uniref:Uncharacterized protein n=1 Tax=Coccidioides immitis H538.4 TaxID=396776 RepID=A0A0J8RXY0_COCIT|nr:hypothetical protein CIHG_07237 [Coccidioides immitis H538.4]
MPQTQSVSGGKKKKKQAAARICLFSRRIERTGARRYILHRDDNSATNNGILVWIFNPDIRYSYLDSDVSNGSPSGGNEGKNNVLATSAQRALKLFYQYTSDIQTLLNPESGTPSSASLEELPLPAHIYEQTESLLNSRTTLLPESARKFREWTLFIAADRRINRSTKICRLRWRQQQYIFDSRYERTKSLFAIRSPSDNIVPSTDRSPQNTNASLGMSFGKPLRSYPAM